MKAAAILLAGQSLPFWLCYFNLEGISAKELAASYSLPETWVEERIEAVSIMLKHQVRVAISIPKEDRCTSHTSAVEQA
jgi:hypothetical protein